MKRFAIIMLAVGLLVLPLTSFAQLFGDPSDDRTPWAFEASVFGHLTNRDLTQMNDHIGDAPEYFGEQGLYAGYENVNTLDDQIATDFRIGFRFQNFHFGGGYQGFGKNSGGYTLNHNFFGAQEYEVELSSREFYGYIGYLHPINEWFSAGPMFSYGFGTLSGTLMDQVDPQLGDREAELSGTYTPFRAEVRGRVKLTRYVCIDIGGGICSGSVADFEADYGINGVYGISGSKGPVPDYQDVPIELDFSGWYIRGGITLLNPLGLD